MNILQMQPPSSTHLRTPAVGALALIMLAAVQTASAGVIYEYTSDGKTIDVFSLSTEAEFTTQELYPAGGTFTTWNSGDPWTIPAGVAGIDYLVVGGGGGGGARTGGGGGACGFVASATPLSVTSGENLTVTVGAGGLGGQSDTASGNQGADSVLVYGSTTITAFGGGYGAAQNNQGQGGSTVGSAGGTGGNSTLSGGTTTSGQGNNGGGGTKNPNYLGGGGGGAGGTGVDAVDPLAGNGGSGAVWSITGLTYAGGGGGAAYHGNSGTPGSGGSGIGGNGGKGTAPTAGADNTGSGGGGSGSQLIKGGNGGTGSVIVSYSSGPEPAITITSIAVQGNGDVVLTTNVPAASLTAQQSEDLLTSFTDVDSIKSGNTLTIASGDVDTNMDGADFFRVRE